MSIRVIFLSMLIFTGCSGIQPEIQVVCETDDVFNYIIKWDVYPEIEGTVKIYASSSPDYFDTNSQPLAEANIAAGNVRLVANHSLRRQYYLIRFNNKYEKVVGTRSQKLYYVQNFRDIGGYNTLENKYIRWGMLYRSGCIDSLDVLSIKRLKLMGIRTLIDFRDTDKFKSPTRRLGLKNVINLPVEIQALSEVEKKLDNNEFLRGDASLYMQDMYVMFAEKYAETFKSMFNQLLVEENYPVIISCIYGKDCTGFAMAMLFHALNIPEESIIEDYSLTNTYFDKHSIPYDVNAYKTETQEAITTMMNADEVYLTCSLEKIKQQYGSINNYMEEELGITPEKRRKLQQILLK